MGKSNRMNQSIFFALTQDGQEYYSNKNYRGFNKKVDPEILVQDLEELKRSYMAQLQAAQLEQEKMRINHHKVEKEMSEIRNEKNKIGFSINQFNRKSKECESIINRNTQTIQNLERTRPNQSTLEKIDDEIKSK